MNACDKDVFDKGELIGIFDMPKEQAEAYCEQESKNTGRKHDWHYAAGRVVIKAIPLAPDYSI